MREELQRLIAKADANDPGSLQALASALSRAGYPRSRELRRPKHVEVFRVGTGDSQSFRVTLKDSQGVTVSFPEDAVLSWVEERTTILIYVPGLQGEG